MNIRERTEMIEERELSPFACLSKNSKGRIKETAPCDMRTCFQRDRDRIIHSKSFRRLKRKTQVFLSPEGDHYRTRLTHTLEVSQIARTIARCLRINEDLTEAISLGHDLGHTPFGHAGERALSECTNGRYRHYLQSVRVAEVVENLNLTYEVKNGIACHTKGKEALTLEGKIVRFADKIAYMNHDIEDSIRAGILREEDIPEGITAVLGEGKSRRITSMIRSIVENTTDEVRMDKDTEEAFWALHKFLFDKVYTHPVAKSQESKAEKMVKYLFEFYSEHPEKMTAEYIMIAENDGIEKAVCDYISGMSDSYAVKIFTEFFVPYSWEN